MNSIIEYISTNWGDLIVALGGIVIAARVIVKLTPTPKDDAILGKVVALLKHVGLVIPDQPKK